MKCPKDKARPDNATADVCFKAYSNWPWTDAASQ